MILPSEAKTLIDNLIINDEGGWKFDEQQDNDGGWTYAGVTAKVYTAYFWEDHKGIYPLSMFKEIVDKVPEKAKELIYEIYYINYYKQLQLDKLPSEIQAAFLSCAVNCGVMTAVKILQRSINFIDAPELEILKIDGLTGPSTIQTVNQCHPTYLINRFLKEWMGYYINLVQQDYIHICDSPIANENIQELYKIIHRNNHVESLEGWFNRVERYR